MPALEQVRIGVSPLTDRIYIGTVSKKDPTLWLSKVDATSQFIANLLTWTEPGTVRTVVGNDGSEFEITVKRTKPANWKLTVHTGVLIDRLRAALAQPETEAEPVAWQVRWIDPEEGPGAWRFCLDPSEADYYANREDHDWRPLYAHPPRDLSAQRTVTAQPMHEAIGFGAYSSKKETT